MDELPEGVVLPKANVAIPRPSASLIVSRMNGNIGEILLCHRVSEVPSFPAATVGFQKPVTVYRMPKVLHV